MRKFFAAAVGSVVAVVGFAGAANASATIDLIWVANGTNQIGGNWNTNPLLSSANIVLQVKLIGSPAGALGTGVSVDYSAVMPSLTVTGFASKKSPPYLTDTLGTTYSTGPGRIVNINATAVPGNGIGLAAGQSALLGTVTFHSEGTPTGTFAIFSDSDHPSNGVLNSKGKNIAASTRFNSAFVTISGPNDFDGDGVDNAIDNCLNHINVGQDDTDADGCGNLCDYDYSNTGTVDFGDFGAFVLAYATTDEEKCHVEPIPGCTVDFGDFGLYVQNYATTPGPGVACP